MAFGYLTPFRRSYPTARGTSGGSLFDLNRHINRMFDDLFDQDDITIDDGVLTLRGEKKSAREDEQTGYRERSYGSFERRITLPANIDEDACSADFRDGVLTITLPKNEEKARGRKIQLGQGRQRGSGAEDQLIEQRSDKNEQKTKEREKESA